MAFVFSCSTFKKLCLIVVICVLVITSYHGLVNVIFLLHGEACCFATEFQKNAVKHMLKSFHNATTEAGMVYWIDMGTLLGAHRYKDIIPWDHDADVGYLLADRTKLKKKVIPILQMQFGITIKAANPVSMKYKNRSVDIFAFASYSEIGRFNQKTNSSQTNL